MTSTQKSLNTHSERRQAVNPHYKHSADNELTAILIVVGGGIFALGLIFGYLWAVL